MADTLLIIEDEDLLADELVRHYRRVGWEVFRADDLEVARKLLLEDSLGPLVVVSDMSLPDGNALDLLEAVRDRSVVGEWVLLTAYGTIPDSARAFRLGAYDFLEKPCPVERLDLVVSGAARSARAQRRLRDQTAERNQRYSPEALVGSSPSIVGVRNMIEKLASVPYSALIIGGETGTGKGLAARILHYSGSRSSGRMVEINCAALPEDLLESEIFGHEAGAFTGAKGRHRGLLEQAHGGTLFLDEIGELSLALQAKLLRAIEDRQLRRLGGERVIDVDVQIIVASNQDLVSRVNEGSFRGDLYHRVSVFHLDMPPLRSRLEDLDDLVPLFVAEYNIAAGKRVRIIPDAAWTAMRRHGWPGNVRELRNAIERCVLLADGEELPVEWLLLGDSSGAVPRLDTKKGGDTLYIPLDGSMSLDDMERHIIEEALRRTGFNVTAAARALGSTRQTLRYRIEKYGIQPPEDS